MREISNLAIIYKKIIKITKKLVKTTKKILLFGGFYVSLSISGMTVFIRSNPAHSRKFLIG